MLYGIPVCFLWQERCRNLFQLVSRTSNFLATGSQCQLTHFLSELRVARNVNREDLFNSGVDLFTDRALLWYRDAKKYVTDWDLVVTLKQEFQPINFDKKLIEEIKKRTQGPYESIGIYLAIISEMFGRLTCPIAEATLKILLRNISPFYQNQLGLVEVTSISHLRTLCRRLEERREEVEAFVPPPRRHALAYVGVEPMPHVNVSELASSKTVAPESRSVRCYNCGQLGHRAIGCGAPRVKKCFRCQKQEYTIKTCPNCKSNEGISTIQLVLCYILHHAKNDERPYLKVSILGVPMLGLLDSGATRIFLGAKAELAFERCWYDHYCGQR